VNCCPLEVAQKTRVIWAYTAVGVQVSIKSYGDCGFRVAAPSLWNRLPVAIINVLFLGKFKFVLLTHLSKLLSQLNNDYCSNLLLGSYKY